ncbi:MAG: extracellular solute-binding protein [Clostridia bacterium]|nr:extracellular solute-binding protein [Clostridia bacterium]
MKNRISVMIRVLCLVLAVLLLGGAAACQKAPVQTGEVDQELTVEELDIRGSILFTVDNSDATDEMMAGVNAVATAFMQDFPNVRVHVEGASRTTFANRISSGDIGDVFWCDENDVCNYHFNHHALMPLDSYLKPLNIDMGDVYTGALECGKYDGRLYMVPRNIGLATLMYNADILKAEGIDFDNSIATDWETFKEYCRQVTQISQDGVVEQAGFSIRLWWDVIWQMFFRAYGGEWVDQKNHRITITDSAEVMRGIQEMYDGVMEGWLFPLGQTFSGNMAHKFSKIPNSDDNFTRVAFLDCVSFTYLDAYGKMYDQADVEWDFCPFPAFENHTVSAGATGYVVFNRTANPNAAAALALYFLTDHGQRAYHSQLGGDVPLLRSLAEDDFWKDKSSQWADKNYAAFVSYTDNTRPATVIVQCPFEVRDILSNEKMTALWNNILSGKVDLQTGFEKMQQQANEKWSLIAN